MKLLQLTLGDGSLLDGCSVFIKAEAIIAFSGYDDGAAINLVSGEDIFVKESPKKIITLLNVASGGDLSVIDSSDVTI